MKLDLVEIVDAALADAARRAGTHLVCHRGCTQCCHGVFEISAFDADRLRRGLDQLTATDPARAARIRDRVAAAQAHLAPWYPGDCATGVLHPDEDAIERFEEWAHADACPVLDPATGTCDLYAHRPILCRTFGPPMRNDPDDPEAGIAICELCFETATPEEIAAAEMDCSFRGEQYATEAAFETAHPATGRTFVAYAFAAPDRP